MRNSGSGGTAAGAYVRLFFVGLISVLCGAEAWGQVTFASTQFSTPAGVLAAPAGVAADGKGHVWIADQGSNRVVEFTSTGTGFGPAVVLATGLASPSGVAVDWSGNVYVADTGNNQILMIPVTLNGYSSPQTVAIGLNSPGGVAVDSAGNLYVADTGNNRIVELPKTGNSFGPAATVGTGFSNPAGVALDSARNIYVADTGNNRIVKEPLLAGMYATQQVLFRNMSVPMGLAVDKSGNVFIADTGNNRIVEEPWAAGANRYGSLMVLGSGFAAPGAVAEDLTGNVFIADTGNQRLTEVVAKSVAFGAVASGAASTTLTYNFNVAAGTTLGNVNVFLQGVTGKDFVDAGGSTCLPSTYVVATICAVNVGFMPQGSGLRLGAVVLLDGDGNSLATAFLSGSGLLPQLAFFPGTSMALGAQLSGPAGVAVDGNGNVYIADTGNNRIVEVPWTGAGYGAQSTLAAGGLNSPMGLAVDGAGNLYIVSNGNDKVLKLAWTGSGFAQQSKVGFGLYGPSNVAVDGVGNVYIANTLDNQLDKIPWTGSGYTQAQSVGNYRKTPMGVAVDAAGNVYFAMPYQNMLVQVPLSGEDYQRQVNLPIQGVSFPSALAVDGNSNLYVLDTGNNRVVMMPWTGSGFGAQITVASGFNAPGGLAVDGNGNLYVADTGNNQVVRIDVSSAAPVSFANTYLGTTSVDSAQGMLVENIGNEPLALDEVTFPSDFPEDAGAVNPCVSGIALAPGTGCTLAIDFTPGAVGAPLMEAVSLTDNTMAIAGSQQSVALSGTSLGQEAQSISFPAIQSVVYGTGPIALTASASSGLAVTYQVVSGPAVLSNGGKSVVVNGVGLVVLQAAQSGNTQFGAASPVTQSFSVAPAQITVTPVNVSAVYGAAPTSFHYTLSGFVLGQTAGQVVTGSAVIVSSAGSGTNWASGTSGPGAGSYTLTASVGTLAASNYTFAMATGTLNISKAVLQVRAVSVSTAYGALLPRMGWVLVGLVNADSASVVGGVPSLSCEAGVSARVGKYAISPSLGSLTAANYNFTFTSGWLTVTPAQLIVSGAQQSMTYGNPVPELAYSIAGFVNGDTVASAVQGSPELHSAASGRPSVGSYAIAITVGSLNAANYSFTFIPGVLQVQKAMLTITARSFATTYGMKLPALSYALQGLTDGDTQGSALKGAPVLKTGAVSSSNPGSYGIAISMGTLVSANYSFTLVNGVISIAKAVLTVKPQATSMTYGQTLPAIGYDFIGFANDDTAKMVQGKPSFTTNAGGTAAVGVYPLTGDVGTLASAHYTFNVLSGKVKVTKAVLAVVGGSQTMTYGGMRPAFTYTLSGLRNGEGTEVVSGKPSFRTGAGSSSPAGSYPIVLGVGTLKASNYSFVYVAGTMTVNPAVLTVTANSARMTYGGTVPTLAYTVTGFVPGDTAEQSITGNARLRTTANAKSNVGEYPIRVETGTLAAKNYSFQFSSGTLAVDPAMLTVTANNLTMKAGAAVPALTYTVTGMVNAETPGSAAKGVPALSTTATAASAADSYPITVAAGGMTSANYTLTFVSGAMTVTQ